jgi:hypothetical protein
MLYKGVLEMTQGEKWSTRTEQLTKSGALNITIEFESAPLSFAEALRRWQNDQEFRSFFMELLANAPYSGFRWETPPVTSVNAGRPFEFVLLDSPGLATKPDWAAFAEHIAAASAIDSVISFSNLGNDAILVVPSPRGPTSAYGHLAAFIRHAPEAQKHAFWQRVGQVMEQRLGPAPVWLSTAGAGVPWLHVRLDDRPKYYGYAPYRNYCPPVA